MKFIRFIFSLSILLVLVLAMNSKLGMLPPLGKFFNPYTGFWQNAETEEELD